MFDPTRPRIDLLMFFLLLKPLYHSVLWDKVEADFAKLQEDGYKIATVSEYVEALHRNKVQPRQLKPFLDAPWRPEDDSGVFTWMGKYVTPGEDDWAIRTQNWQTRSWLLAAETSENRNAPY
jgi:hypothetical protein